MNKGQLIGAALCLGIAALLTVLNFTQPPENMMFMVGDSNVPWVPPIILGIVGAVLLIAAIMGKPEASKASQEIPPELAQDPEKVELNKRFETIGWGLFLIMLGGFVLVPQTVVAKGFWSIGVGVIMLGLNAARYLNKIRMSGFTTFLGIISLLSGIAQLLGWTTLDGVILLIVLGAYVILKPLFDKKQLFGKAEQR